MRHASALKRVVASADQRWCFWATCQASSSATPNSCTTSWSRSTSSWDQPSSRAKTWCVLLVGVIPVDMPAWGCFWQSTVCTRGKIICLKLFKGITQYITPQKKLHRLFSVTCAILRGRQSSLLTLNLHQAFHILRMLAVQIYSELMPHLSLGFFNKIHCTISQSRPLKLDCNLR